ncbi:HGGxSTG domain-containing protein [Sphingomonas sp. NPDC019816]|uniref:HGGxSTG domain-containing protein n=1 Tax=Sphingomonas sp. NPDC019816 TaxID=3390679 RepID=UPI003D04C84A
MEPDNLRNAPRCLARTRRGTACQSPAMPNGRCRLHGGSSPGAPPGNQNALKHGLYSSDYLAVRRAAAAVRRDLRAMLDEIG